MVMLRILLFLALCCLSCGEVAGTLSVPESVADYIVDANNNPLKTDIEKVL